MLNKIILGTANFNKNYSLIKKNSFKDAQKVIAYAKKKKVKTIDFAPRYIKNKKILHLIAKSKFKVISKIPSIKKVPRNELQKFIERQIFKNLSIFNSKDIFCILFHDSSDFHFEKIKDAITILNNFKNKKIIEKIGVSIYNPEEVNLILNKFKPHKPDIIQLPYNIFDNRFQVTGVLKKLKKLKIEVHARSIFLQGLFFKDAESLPGYFDKWKKEIKKFQKNKNDDIIYNICYNFVNNNKFLDKIIVGFKFPTEIKKFFKNIEYPPIKVFNKINLVNDVKLVNPNFWEK